MSYLYRKSKKATLERVLKQDVSPAELLSDVYGMYAIMYVLIFYF